MESTKRNLRVDSIGHENLKPETCNLEHPNPSGNNPHS
jgi:hypothetical protein